MMKNATTRMRAATWVVLLAGLSLLAGCQGKQSQVSLSDAYAAYDRGDYRSSYQMARMVAGSGKANHEAAYLAGLSAYRLGTYPMAARYLGVATASPQKKLAGDAYASLGMTYASMGRFADSGIAYEQAAKRLSGQDQANAYYYSAIEFQKQGRWSQARSNLVLARAASNDENFKRQATEMMAVTGFTLQTGFFTVRDNAQRAAEQVGYLTKKLRMGQPRIVPAVDAQGRSGYLVQVGQFSSYPSALASKDKFGDFGAMVVPLLSR
ncbi:MAG: SPOR domain-containing protein [Phycisphaeraceae bacterium]|nr:SPOR domain-containing protein [Phycisphaeraceae bacterium]